MDKWEALVNCITKHQTLLLSLAIVLLAAVVIALVLYINPVQTDVYGLWCSLKCEGEVECIRECMMDRPGWWK